MASSNREHCINLILEVEGGDKVSTDRGGGLTKFGISQRAYPNLNIQTLTRDKAIQIYTEDYWAPISADYLRSGVDLLTFDCAVNQGVKTAIKLLQIAARVKADGLMGPVTIAAQAASQEVLWRLGALRMVRYGNTTDWQTYGPGWANRLFRVFEAAVELQ
jgi:lysozyme family protein